jgi:hypothetical protein
MPIGVAAVVKLAAEAGTAKIAAALRRRIEALTFISHFIASSIETKRTADVIDSRKRRAGYPPHALFL